MLLYACAAVLSVGYLVKYTLHCSRLHRRGAAVGSALLILLELTMAAAVAWGEIGP